MIQISKDFFGEQVVDDCGNLDYRNKEEVYVDVAIDVSRSIATTAPEDILRSALSSLEGDWKIYFVFSESISTPTSRMKSYQKLFYKERKSGVFNQRELYEFEIEAEEGKSILAAIIKPSNNASFEYIMDNLVDSRLKYVYLVEPGKRSFRVNMAEHLRTAIGSRFEDINTIILDREQLAKRLVGKNSHLVTFMRGANERDRLNVVSRKTTQRRIGGLYDRVQGLLVAGLN